jgi:two-component system chemotaxis sensor kinase CheA
MDDLLADFLTETDESLAELDVALVKLERSPGDEATLALIFRMVHTIKGTCGFLGLPRLERVAHAAESVLGRVRDRKLTATPEIVTQVLDGLDRIKAILAGLRANGAEPAGDDAALIATLDGIAERRARRAPPPDAVPQASPGGEPVAGAEPTAGEAAAASQTIRVGVDVLEGLMTLVSELVLTRNQLLQLARTEENPAFTVPLQRLSHITSDLQEGVVKTRMQPIGNAWNKLPRLVRDLARDLGKRIELIMLGAETELDRQVLELIKDPLTHMVRNCADHGLEPTEARRAAGKPESGRITLNAYHEGGHILIEIADDGAGLPTAKIRAKAISLGFATEAELAAMTEAQIQRFILRPGFSTAAAVTAVSGRGVGMDVVKSNIERIGGTIDLKSVAGQGTTVTVKIPLTLAIVSALIVQAGGERFAIPQISVVELVRARAAALDGAAADHAAADPAGETSVIERINDTPVLRLRERLLPLVSLTGLLHLEGAAETRPDDRAYIVVTQVGATTLGIIVDRVFDTEEIVVKPVAPILRHITMFSGNTILGDGSVIMILDPNGIARATGVGVGGGDPRAAGRDPQRAGPSLHGADGPTAMLLFRAGDGAPLAVPLALVARLEDIPRARIESSAGQPVTQYRGQLMPLVPFAGALDAGRERFTVLVFSDDSGGGPARSMGLVVDEIVDVVKDRLRMQLGGARPGLLGTAIINGASTDVIDIAHYLTLAFGDWFKAPRAAVAANVLVVDDSGFFRQMLAPAMTAAGFRVTAVASAAEALARRDAGEMFAAIVSDIQMPEIDGFELVRRIRAEGAWAELPVIALSGSTEPADIARGRAAGFTDYVTKFERDALLASLRQCLGQGAPPLGLAA